jgi:hypothetical protein
VLSVYDRSVLKLKPIEMQMSTLVVGLLLVGICAVGLWWRGYLHEWMPNVATDAFTLALGITVIDSAIKRNARERLRPRIRLARASLARAIRGLAEGVALDYATTHLATYRRPPADLDGVIDHWLAEQSRADSDPQTRVLPDAADRAAREISLIRITSYDVLEPGLLTALDLFSARAPSLAEQARQAAPGIREDDLRTLALWAQELAAAVVAHRSGDSLIDFGVASVGGDWTKFHDAHHSGIHAQARRLESQL